MDIIHKKEYNIRDLGTRSVTLFPTRAQVVRDIKDVPLKPGANEITVVGLTPTVDEQSVKVEGTGSATISDIAVELLPNREIFQEIYPDSDDDKSDNESEEEDDDDDDDDKDSPALAAVRDKLSILNDEKKRANEIISSAESRLKILDAYGKQLDRKKGIEIEKSIETYRTEREKVFQDQMAGLVKNRELNKEIADVTKEEAHLEKLQQKEKLKAAKVKAKIQKTKDKEKEKESRRKAERLKERERIRKERENFWPRFVYSVRITLDAAAYTPMSSRRASIASDIVKVPEKMPDDEEAAMPTCDLSLSYVTTSAFWSPTYDLKFSTISNTAALCFDAQLTNATSETWNGCKVTLSTSQSSSSGLAETIPTLRQWRIKLASRSSLITESKLLNSREERAEREAWKAKQNTANIQKPRANLFGVEPEKFAKAAQRQDMLQQQQMVQQQHNWELPQAPLRRHMQTRGVIQESIAGKDAASKPSAPRSSLFGSMTRRSVKRSPVAGAAGGHEGSGSEDEDEVFGGDRTITEPQPELEFQESAVEETGFTTTYDLPGLKTLPPRKTASKQRVARISFANVVFSHTVIAKYTPVAYLKAKLKNSSKLTLLRGSAGLTLDDSFLGRTNLPHCSAGDTFSMSLGVDPAIKVIYPKPVVRRATTGLFSKEDSSAYSRSITIANTRASAGKPVTLLVLDQIPVSEDERLKVELLAPVGGTATAAGVPGRNAKDDKDWGKATAQLKTGGEVCWDVSLNAGKAVKLGLEYVVGLPLGDHAIQCD